MGLLDWLFPAPDVPQLAAKRDIWGLISAMTYRKTAAVRQAAADAIRTATLQGGRRDAALAALVRLLGDAEADVRVAAAMALGQHRCPEKALPKWRMVLVETLSATDPVIRARSAMLLAHDDSYVPDDARTCDRTLASMAEMIRIDHYTSAAQEGSPLIRDTLRLARRWHDHILPTMAQALADSDGYVRAWAIQVLLDLRSEAATELLVRALDGQDAHHREHIARSLARRGDRRAIPILLSDPPSDLDGTAELLAGTRDPTLADLTLPLLRHQSPRMRGLAAAVLGRLHDERALESLPPLLRDGVWEVRHSAAHALKRLGWRAKTDEPRAWMAVSLHDWEEALSCGSIAEEAVLAEMGELAKMRFFDRCGECCRILTKIGSEKATGGLLRLLLDRCPDSTVIRTLEQVIDRYASRISVDELSAAAALGDFHIAEYPTKDGEPYYTYGPHRTDFSCSGIRDRAKRELERRREQKGGQREGKG